MEAAAADRWIDPRPWTGPALSDYSPRARATLIDLSVGAVPVVLGLLLVGAGAEAVGWTVVAVAAACGLLQPPLAMRRPGARNGQSWGKQVTGIRVLRDDGRPITTLPALARETLVKALLLFWIGLLFLGIPWVIDVLWPLWDDQRRAIHDIVVGTHVVLA